jgi:hypothetical protein
MATATRPPISARNGTKFFTRIFEGILPLLSIALALLGFLGTILIRTLGLLGGQECAEAKLLGIEF